MEKKLTRKQAIRRRRIFISLCAVALVAAIAIIAVAIGSIKNALTKELGNELVSSEITSSKEEEPIKKIASATVVNTGDIIIHAPILNGAKSGDTHDFSAFYKFASDHFKSADLAVANLEVAVAGEAAGYTKSGVMSFNAPDVLLDNLTDAGLNFLLTANNHCYDRGLSGLTRTAAILKEKNIPFIGTKETNEDPDYLIKDVNGIKLGMACYTYETGSAETKSINGNPVQSEGKSLIKTFNVNRLDEFYREVEHIINEMKQSSDAVIFYMHWGDEYQLTPNTHQKAIAQKLCNLGVDVIVGGHPHVIQPMELLYSEDGQNTTVCLYSMGNSISNQRREALPSYKALVGDGKTESGLLFYYTFDKYSDGSTVLAGVDIIPAWLNRYPGGNGYQYTLIPLETADDGASKYSLTGDAAAKAKASFESTKGIVADGLRTCQEALGCTVRFPNEASAQNETTP